MTKKYRDENWLRRKYCEEMLDGTRMAELAACNPTTLYKWMDKFGIQRRPKGAKVGALNSAWKGGKTTFICEVCGKEFKRYNQARFCSWDCKLIGMAKKPVECVCVVCGKSFFTDSHNRRNYCSNTCRYRQEVKICEVCGVEFVGPNQRFCSMDCRNIAFSNEGNPNHRGGQLVPCENCGRKVWKRPSELDNHQHSFCSSECHDEWRSLHMLGSNNHNWQSEVIELVCSNCGKKFEVKKSPRHERGDYKLRQFCSQECAWESRTGEGNHFWRGGKSFEPYPPTFNRAFKRKIRERDDHRCAICWLPGRAVHHINYVKKDTNPMNCVTLCRYCHAKTNHNRSYWRPALEAIMEARWTSQ